MREKLIYGLGVIAAVLLVRNLYSIFMQLPDEASQGMIYRIIFFHVPAAITAMLVRGRGLRRQRRVPGHQELQVRCHRRGGHRSRAGVPGRQPGHRLHLGPHHLGHLVDLGRAPHLRAGLLAALCRIPDAAPRHRRAHQRATHRGGLQHLRLRRVPIVIFSIKWWRTQHPQPVFWGGGSIDPAMYLTALLNWSR